MAVQAKKKTRIIIKHGQKRRRFETTREIAHEQPKTTTARLAEFLTSIANDDLLLELFTRLPNSRDVCHCAAVCRQWRSVISHPQFVTMFKRHHQKQLPTRPPPFTLLLRDCQAEGILISDESKKLHGPDRCASKAKYLDFLPAGSVVMASCKDLLLVKLPAARSMCVCNPLTRQWVPLPEPPLLREQGGEARILHDYLAKLRPVEPDIQRYTFVCDDPDDHSEQMANYRVVVWRKDSLRLIRAAVFRSEMGRWDELVRTVPFGSGLYAFHMAIGTIDGVIYTPLTRGDNSLEKIAALDPFDVQTGLESREVSLPVGFKRGWRGMCSRARIGVVRGRLRLWQSYLDKRAARFVLKAWQLNKKYDDWVSVLDLRLAMGDDHSKHFTEASAVMALHPDDDDVFFFKDDNPNIWQYRIGTGSCEKIGEIDKLYPTAVVYTVVHQPWPTVIPHLHSF